MAGPTTPDEFEQRQELDGSLADDDVVDAEPDRPLTPDELEQRQVLEEDDRDEHPVEEDEDEDDLLDQ